MTDNARFGRKRLRAQRKNTAIEKGKKYEDYFNCFMIIRTNSIYADIVIFN